MINRLGSPFKINSGKVSPYRLSSTSSDGERESPFLSPPSSPSPFRSLNKRSSSSNEMILFSDSENELHSNRSERSSFYCSDSSILFPSFGRGNSRDFSFEQKDRKHIDDDRLPGQQSLICFENEDRSAMVDIARAITSLELSTSLLEALENILMLKCMLVKTPSTVKKREFCRIALKRYQFAQTYNTLIELHPEWDQELQPHVQTMSLFCVEINHFLRVPAVLIQEIFQWLSYDAFASYALVCRQWKEMLYDDIVWKTYYARKFASNETALSLAALSKPCHPHPKPGESFRERFHARLLDPEIGDKVEVAWKGKFRLESVDVYQGLAWWVAEVVDKHSSQFKYKIRYPGWESRWDEWVSRARFRWLVDNDESSCIHEGDEVELWCCGANVPGAWLETRVVKIADGQYCLKKVSTAGPMWVSRGRLRLSSRKPLPTTCDLLVDPHQAALRAEPGTSDVDLQMANGRACSIM